MTNELQNRLSKVYKLADTFEGHTFTLSHARRVDVLESAIPELWITLAKLANVSVPSTETQRLVIHFFAERAKWADDPFEGLPQ